MPEEREISEKMLIIIKYKVKENLFDVLLSWPLGEKEKKEEKTPRKN